MERSPHSSAPTAMTRPRAAHRFEVFSPKLSRRLTVYRRAVLDAWMLIETDPSVVTFSERPGTVLIGENRHQVDFSVRYADRDELLIAADSPVYEDADVRDTINTLASPIRFIPRAELVAARMWIDNWHRMLPSLVATRGLISASLLKGIERFANKPQQLGTIEREFSTGDPTVVRAATFRLLHEGRLSAPDLRAESLSLITPFVIAGAPS
jgi:hypothetical protein